jgi:hypothetical protein
MGNPTPSELKQLRKRFFDGSDQFMNGSAVFGKAGPHHDKRIANMHLTDPWAFDDEQMRRGQTASRVARAMGTNAKQVEDTIRRIRKAAAGLRTTGKPRTNTRGRPKKRPGRITPQVPPGQ